MTRAILDVGQAAAEMRVAESTIRSWIAKGWLKVGARGPRRKAYFVRADLLKAELRARRGEPS